MTQKDKPQSIQDMPIENVSVEDTAMTRRELPGTTEKAPVAAIARAGAAIEEATLRQAEKKVQATQEEGEPTISREKLKETLTESIMQALSHYAKRMEPEQQPERTPANENSQDSTQEPQGEPGNKDALFGPSKGERPPSAQDQNERTIER